TVSAPFVTAARPLHLDDVSAEVAQYLRADRAGEDAGHVDDPDTLQGKLCRAHDLLLLIHFKSCCAIIGSHRSARRFARPIYRSWSRPARVTSPAFRAAIASSIRSIRQTALTWSRTLIRPDRMSAMRRGSGPGARRPLSMETISRRAAAMPLLLRWCRRCP